MKTMRTIKRIILFVAFATLVATAGCGGTGSRKQKQVAAPTVEESSIPDTGFTGVKKYPNSKGEIVREATFKNGVRHGETKIFRNGVLYQTFQYENDILQDTNKWFYNTGELYRATPYVNDTIHGIQTQYYRTGNIRAKLGYEHGKRNDYIEEFYNDGRKYTNYPTIVAEVTDSYASNGTYRIELSLTDDKDVLFYKGFLENNLLDTAMLEELKVTNKKATITLKKSGTATTDKMGIVARVLTPFGNRYIATKTLTLPYNDLR